MMLPARTRSRALPRGTLYTSKVPEMLQDWFAHIMPNFWQVVADELKALMGVELAPLVYSRIGPTVILLAGLQGVGKTTAAGKLALYLKKQVSRNEAGSFRELVDRSAGLL